MDIYLALKNDVYDGSSEKIKLQLLDIFGINGASRNQVGVYFHKSNFNWNSKNDIRVCDIEVFLYGMNPKNFYILVINENENDPLNLIEYEYGNTLEFAVFVEKTVTVLTPFIKQTYTFKNY